jgi:large subunit ribosomal protein L24
MKLKKGDQIKMMVGKDAGKTGKILAAMPTEERIMVEGINMFKKRSRPKKQGETGQTVEVPRPFPASRAQLICASCKSPTRIGARAEGNAKVRYCKKCKATI